MLMAQGTQEQPEQDRKSLLLVDPNSLFRRTLAMVARELRVADVYEASSHEAARRLLETQHFDAMLLDLGELRGEGLGALAIVQNVRQSSLRCPPDLPIGLTAEQLDMSTMEMFKQLEVKRFMLKPFKVKTALAVVAALVGRQAV
jgi:CheY-like chemotaxis protein